MSRQRRPTTLAQPPWTYAPSEVMAWVSSGAQRGPKEKVSRLRPVGQVSARCSPSEGNRAIRRFDRLVARVVPPGSVHPPMRPSILVEEKSVREGRFAGVRVRLVVRQKPDHVLIHLKFHPALSSHRARRLLTQLGINPTEASDR